MDGVGDERPSVGSSAVDHVSMDESGEQEPSGPTLAAATALDEPTGLTAAATALDELTGPTAAATAFDELTDPSAAATALDGQSGPTATTALDEPTGLTATMAAGAARDELTGAVPDDAMGLPTFAASAPVPPTAGSGEERRSQDSMPGELKELGREAEQAEADEAWAAALEEELLDDLMDMRQEVAPTTPDGASANAASPAPEKAAPATAGSASASTAAPAPEKVPEEPSVPPPPPPPPPPAAASTAADQFDGAAFIDESRYMQDPKGNYLHKWKVDYAARGGAGVAMCRDLECLERLNQGGVRSIEKGELRIGRRVLMDKDGANGHVVIMWYHARCIFNTFLRSRKQTRVIESVEDLEGFHDITTEDQELLRRIIAGNEDVRAARSRTTGPRPANKTPEKRPAPGGIDPEGLLSSKKARGKKDEEKRLLRKGDRVWTFCRVRPPAAPDRPGGAPVVREFAVKSPKPELGMIIEEAKDDTILVQFESQEHEQERIEKYLSTDKRLAKIKSWFMYPRVFEGKKQRLPLNWVQSKPPPRLCGCSKQQWAHSCDCGISCTRGTSTKVWGVGQ